MTTTGPARDLGSRSLEVILAHQAPSGAFVAGPTFSQYGYAWFRDGAFIAEALDLVGRPDAAGRFHAWAARVVAERTSGMEQAMRAVAAGVPPAPDDVLHCRYTVDGERGPNDWPTFQLDGPGIWLWSLAHHARHGGRLEPAWLAAAAVTARYIAALRDLPAHDAWEESPDVVHTSTRTATLAGLRAAGELGLLDAAGQAACDALDEALFGDDRVALTKWDGNVEVDASLLWAVTPYGLRSPADRVAAATIRRVETELVDADGGVHRYRRDTYYGGGAWILLTAGLARVRLARDGPGDAAAARDALRWIEAQAAPDGELPEQVDTRAFHPERIAKWRALWGESARPLLWSHAAYLALRADLERAGVA